MLKVTLNIKDAHNRKIKEERNKTKDIIEAIQK
jgi:hypothetical protein